jgi:hypothetical protein
MDEWPTTTVEELKEIIASDLADCDGEQLASLEDMPLSHTPRQT